MANAVFKSELMKRSLEKRLLKTGIPIQEITYLRIITDQSKIVGEISSA